VPPVGGPVHGVDLGQMALERLAGLHELVLWELLLLVPRDAGDCIPSRLAHATPPTTSSRGHRRRRETHECRLPGHPSCALSGP
jgi:hypothetical protein